MASRSCLVGIDVGTSSIKAAAFDTTGHNLATISAPTPTVQRENGVAEHHPEELWRSVSSTLRGLRSQLRSTDRVAALGVVSVGEAGIFLDDHGRPLHPMLAWFDERAAPQADELTKAIGASEMYRITGMSLTPHHAIAKLRWIRQEEPSVFSAAHKWLGAADYVAYRLTGAMATDPTLAARTSLFDRHAGSWSGALLEAAYIPENKLPEIRPTGALLGQVTKGAAEMTGLDRGTNVAVGGHDHVCAAYVARGGADAAVHSCGTASGLMVPTPSPLSSHAGNEAHVACSRDVDDRFLISAPTGVPGRALAWMAKMFYPGETIPAVFDQMEEEVPTPLAFTGLACSAELDRPSSPRWDDSASGVSFSGLSARHSRAHLVQAILESNAFSLRENLDWLETRDITVPSETFITGGAVQNDVWMDITAQVLGRVVSVVSEPQTAALAAASLGGVAEGIFQDVKQAAAAMQPDHRQIRPSRPLSEVYDRAFSSVHMPSRSHIAQIHRLLSAFDQRLE